MKKISKIIIFLCVIIFILIITLLIILGTQKKEQKEIAEQVIIEYGENDGYNNLEEMYGIVLKITDENEYYTVKKIVEKYIYLVSENNYESAIKLMNPTIISDINEKNIYTKTGIEKTKNNYEYYDYYISNAYKVIADEDRVFYIVKGDYVSSESGKSNNMFVLIELDMNNYVYNIYYDEFVKANKYNELKLNDKIEFKITKIENKEDNIFEVTNLTELEIITNYLNDFKDQIYLKDNKTLYQDYIYEEYRNKRFETLEEFSNYLKDSKKTFANINLTQYIIDKGEGYIDYICIDQHENYYIFRKYDEAMKYKVILDTYTLEDEAFNKQYESAGTQRKVMMNIDKFITMINCKDYEGVYNLLDEEFRTNKFGNIEKFKEYILSNFYEYNKVIYNSIKTEGYNNIYYISLVNKKDEDELKNMMIIMQLKEETDFIMSYSFE